MKKPENRATDDRTFFVGWMLANFIGGSVASVAAVMIVAMFMFSRADIAAILLIASLVAGPLLGTIQWFALRTRLSGSAGWILATTAGLALGAPLVVRIQRTSMADVPEFLMPFLLALLFGATLGVCQWFVLRKQSWSGLWILVTALATAVVIPLIFLVSSIPIADGAAWLGYGSVFLIHAAMSGAGLLWLLQPAQAGTETRVHRSRSISLILVTGVSLVIALLWLLTLIPRPPGAGSAESAPMAAPTSQPMLQATLQPGPGEILLAGHKGSVRSVAFSPDGRTVASASADGTLKTWNAQTGTNIRTFQPGEAVLSVAFAPDGNSLAAGLNARDGQPNLKVWDIVTGKELQSIAAHTRPVYSVAYSPDAQFLVTGSIDKTLTVWRVDTWLTRAIFSGHSDWVYSVAIAPDSATIASASWDHTVKLWNLGTQASRTLTGHTDKVMSVAYSPDGRLLASGAADAKIKLWDVATGAELRTLSGHGDAVNSVAFAPDGRTLASGSDDGTVKLWDVRSGEVTQTWHGYADRVTAVSFSPDGHSVISGSADGTVRLRIINP